VISRSLQRTVETVDEQSSSLLVQFRDWRSRVSNSEFYVSRERVFFRTPHGLEHDPALALRLFEFVGRHGMRPALDAMRRLDENAGRLRQYFRAPAAPLWPALQNILATPHCSLALRVMHETGALAAIFPEWEPVECLVIRDFYHRYTVDEHTLRAIELFEELRTSKDPARAQFAGLYSEVDHPGFVAFALLFHDLGKADRGESHVAGSLALAGAAMARLGLPEEQRHMVHALIERHLDLSSAMNSRDLDDPKTPLFVAGRVETLEILKRLALVTYADISAVNPSAMSPWRLEQLWRVYLIAYNELTRELETERIRQTAVLESAEAKEFLAGFPVRYLRTHTHAEIEAHFQLEQRSRERGVAVDIRKENGFYRLTLVTRDRPALLAALAGALAGFGLNILKAEGFANRHGTILDTFVFEDPHRALELNPSETDRLRLTLERVALGKLDVKDLLRSRPAPAPPSKRSRIAPTVSFDSHASESATLIEVTAEDRPGLLFALTSAISATGANIDVVLIDTQAHKAIDVFYVTSNGKKLPEPQHEGLKARLLKACAA
jgi:[protein-PII] uridylyltransferase